MYSNYRKRPGRPRVSGRDLSYFADQSPASLYWLGFLFANASFSGSNTLRIIAPREYREHLLQLVRYMGAQVQPFTPGKMPHTIVVAIYTSWLVNYLPTIGCLPRMFDRTLYQQQGPDFWRGYFDGNGNIEKHVLYLQATLPIMKYWWAFVSPCLPRTADVSMQQRPRWHEFVAEGDAVPAILSLLYQREATLLYKDQVLAAPPYAAAASSILATHLPSVANVSDAQYI